MVKLKKNYGFYTKIFILHYESLHIVPWLCIQNDTTSLYKDRFCKFNEVPDCALVVDSGYSFTHIVPFVMGRPILPAIRR